VSLLNPDFRDMLLALSAEGAEFLVVGAYAVAAHGIPRATGDLDVWVGTEGDNPARVLRALQRFGAPVERVAIEELRSPDLIFQIGVVPQRIDIITGIEGVAFGDAYARQVQVELDDVVVPVLALDDLLANKRAVGRPKDLADIEALERRK
jgi:hypothetical protein